MASLRLLCLLVLLAAVSALDFDDANGDGIPDSASDGKDDVSEAKRGKDDVSEPSEDETQSPRQNRRIAAAGTPAPNQIRRIPASEIPTTKQPPVTKIQRILTTHPTPVTKNQRVPTAAAKIQRVPTAAAKIQRVPTAAAPANNRVAPATTTTPAPRTKQLVTLSPIGDSIQAILFNNGYRDRPADAEPQPNNIDDETNLGGLDRRSVWLMDRDLLVLRGGKFAGDFVDSMPIDDYQAPYREPKFPPLGFVGEGELPPGLFVGPYGRGPLIPELSGGVFDGPYNEGAYYGKYQMRAQPYNSRSYRARNGHGSYLPPPPPPPPGRVQVSYLAPTPAPPRPPTYPSTGPTVPPTYSVRTSYSSIASTSSTSTKGPAAHYLPPSHAPRGPVPSL